VYARLAESLVNLSDLADFSGRPCAMEPSTICLSIEDFLQC
jgi:hypothetical protein